MVDREANIDLLFRNGLKDYEVLPPQDIWDSITPVIKKQRSFISLRIAASVAVIVSLGAASYFLVNKINSDLSNPTLTFNNEGMPESSRAEGIVNRKIAVRTNNISPAQIPVNDPVDSDILPAESKYYLPEPGLYTSFTDKKSVRKQGQDASSVTIGPISYNVSNSGNANTSNAELDLKDETGSARESGRWSIGALVIPSYYSSINLSPDDAASDLVKAEEPAVSYSGGFSFAYKVGKRLSIQTGLYYSSFGQKVTGVDTYSGFSEYYNAKGPGMFSVMTSSGTITSTNRDMYLADNNTGSRVLTTLSADVFDPVKADLSYINNSIHQNFNYLEIPFMMKYKLFDRNIDFNLTGGISYNILINNTVYAMTGGEKYYIGETGSLSPVTFSSSVGMGVEYSFSKKLSLNLEPIFRYYITPLGGLAGSAIHPYSFGVLSGISYRF